MRQLVYISSATPGADVRPAAVLRVSQANNRRDGVTGLLFYNGRRFLQALEGSEEAVAATLARIRGDARHRAIVVLSDRAVAAREFGEWAMADATAPGDAAAFLSRIERLVAQAAPAVRATFASYALLPAAA